MNRSKMAPIVKISIVFLIVLFFGAFQETKAQEDKPYDSPKEPVNCEMANLYISDALTRYVNKRESKNSYLIIIFRLGDGENSRKLNLMRIKALKSYIENIKPSKAIFGDVKPNVKAIYAEGERIDGFGIIEIYLNGNLLYSLPIKKGRDLDLISCFT